MSRNNLQNRIDVNMRVTNSKPYLKQVVKSITFRWRLREVVAQNELHSKHPAFIRSTNCYNPEEGTISVDVPCFVTLIQSKKESFNDHTWSFNVCSHIREIFFIHMYFDVFGRTVIQILQLPGKIPDHLWSQIYILVRCLYTKTDDE